MAQVKITTTPLNRKDVAQAFGQNQTVIRQLETMTRDITVNIPDAINGNGSSSDAYLAATGRSASPGNDAKAAVTELQALFMTMRTLQSDVSRLQALVNEVTASLLAAQRRDTASISYRTIDGTPIGQAVPSVAIFSQVSSANAIITGGSINGTPVGATTASTGAFTALTATTSGSTNTVTATDTGANGANLLLAGNGAITPNKYLRSQSGTFQIINSAYSAVLLTVTDAGALSVSGGITGGSATLISSSVALTNGAAAQTATLTNGPTAGNPTKWVPINDNGVTRYIPAW